MGIYNYPIEERWQSKFPQLAYRNGAYEGFVFHFTDNYASKLEGEISYMISNFQNAFVHAFVGADGSPGKIVEIQNPSYACWGCGPYGNSRFYQTEFTVAQDQKTFDTSFDAMCYLAAKKLFDRKLGVIPVDDNNKGNGATLWSHADVSKYLGGTDHQDPIDYLAKWGKSWADVVALVQQYYQELGEPDTQPAPVDDW